MLKPEYFTDGKEEKILELYRQLEEFIMRDTARRLLKAGQMTGTADRLLYKLREMGESAQEIQKRLMQLTGLSNIELQALLQDAVLTSWDDDKDIFNQMGVGISSPLENPVVISVMDAEYKKSMGELENLTRTTMNKAQSDLITMLDEVDLRMASGTQSYSAAVCDVLDRYAGAGFQVSYPTGTTRTLEAAVNCCVRTAMNQTAAQVTNQYIVEAEVNYVLVSAHLGARVKQKNQPDFADHSLWQGKAYRIRGKEQGFPNLLESTGYDIDPTTGQGTVVNPLGLHGYNCRHSHQPWDKSLRNPWVDENGKPIIDSEKSREVYEKNQKARAMERAIRKTERELFIKEEEIKGVAETDVKEILQKDYERLDNKRMEQNKAYNEYCERNGMQPQYERLRIAEGNKSRVAEKIKEHKVTNGSKSDNIKDMEIQDVTEEYLNKANPGIGKITKEDGYNEKENQRELKFADWILNTQGGNIKCLKKSNKYKVQRPDFEWDSKLWDLKNPTTTKAANSATRHGISQISENPGGVFLDYENNEFSIEEVEKLLEKRVNASAKFPMDVMIIQNGKMIKAIRYKK